jgi:hypothetical protein
MAIRRIFARYEQACRRCGRLVLEGDPILWATVDRTVTHADCAHPGRDPFTETEHRRRELSRAADALLQKK